jgi:hypothetical protein
MIWLRVIQGAAVALFLGSCASLHAQPASPSRILRFVEGIDAASKSMPADEVAQLNDPWAVLVLRKGVFPKDINAALDSINAPDVLDGGYVQESFFVSESGQLPVNAKVNREFRTVITLAKPAGRQPTILFSAPAGQREGFIELMSWDPAKKAFNFYRRPKDEEWTWKGDTLTAFRSATAAKGCFMCHVHGTPVMKELRAPWNNWHSQSASIPPEAIPSEAIRNSGLFINKSEGQLLELIVKGWISTGLDDFFTMVMQGEEITDARTLLRPLFETDTANLQSSHERSKGVSAHVDLPPGFFLNFDAFSNIFGLKLLPDFSGVIDRQMYAAAVDKYDFRLSDGAGFTQQGDTHFGFLVPVASESGTAILRELISRSVITQHFALSVLTVDFPNPVYSPARSGLLKYLPEKGHLQDGQSDLADEFVHAIQLAAPGTPVGSPERQFLANWKQDPDTLRSDAATRIRAYQSAVLARLKTQDGVNDYTRLAESRRQRFAKTSLNEFPLLLPVTSLPAALDLQMLPDGKVCQ